MRKNNKGYKIAIIVLSLVVFIETILLVNSWVTKPKKITRRPPPVAIKGKIAIIIDDWGYNLDNLALLKQIKYPITQAVLPNLSYSRALAQQFRKLGLEIILHLPMEPHELVRLEQDTIMTTMDDKQISNIINKDLASVGYASGVSNHMGSKATEDRRLMEIIFGELRKRNLYFLDSMVSGESVCSDLTAQLGLAFIQRDIFLDNSADPAYIKGQINKLKMKTDIYGKAVGIGHARRATLETLNEVMPQLAKEGYKFVFVSELVRKRH